MVRLPRFRIVVGYTGQHPRCGRSIPDRFGDLQGLVVVPRFRILVGYAS